MLESYCTCKHNSVYPTAVKIVQCRHDDKLAAQINIHVPSNEIAIIESQDFPWPTNITFKT